MGLVTHVPIAVGSVFGRWTVIARGANLGSNAAYVVTCSCGTESLVRACALYGGRSRGCRRCAKYQDIAGQKFGRVVAVARVQHKSKRLWLCRCDCGRKVYATVNDLRTGHTSQCRSCSTGAKNRIYKTKHAVDVSGFSLSIPDAAAALGVSSAAMYSNVRRSKPALHVSSLRRVIVDGVPMSIADACEHFGVVKPTTANWRIRNGVHPLQAVSEPACFSRKFPRE